MEPLPEGYEWGRAGAFRGAFRSEARDALLGAGFTDPAAFAGRSDPAFAGRGRPVRVPLPDGSAGVLRRYLHGGVLRRLTGRWFTGAPRPVRELVATVRAERAGVRVPVVLAALWRPRAGLLHEGFLLTREETGKRDLAAALADGAPAAAALSAVGRETRRLHEAGVWHADLHVRNVLLGADGATLLDFDRARVLSPVPADLRLASLLRFDRSVVKLARRGPTVRAADRLRFFKAYFGTRPDRRERDALAARCRRSLAWHRLWWGVTS